MVRTYTFAHVPADITGHIATWKIHISRARTHPSAYEARARTRACARERAQRDCSATRGVVSDVRRCLVRRQAYRSCDRQDGCQHPQHVSVRRLQPACGACSPPAWVRQARLQLPRSRTRCRVRSVGGGQRRRAVGVRVAERRRGPSSPLVYVYREGARRGWRAGGGGRSGGRRWPTIGVAAAAEPRGRLRGSDGRWCTG